MNKKQNVAHVNIEGNFRSLLDRAEKLANLDSKQFDDFVEENYITEEVGDSEERRVNVSINPDTGEYNIIGPAEEQEDFNSFIDKINSGELSIDLEQDLKKVEFEGNTLSDSALLEVIELSDRYMKGEKFNIYKEFPDEAKKIVDDYIKSSSSYITLSQNHLNGMRKAISINLMKGFIDKIKLQNQTDIALELEKFYQSTSNITDISDDNSFEGKTFAYRNKVYKKCAARIENPAKREKMFTILNRIDDTISLDELKEFASRCKIKQFDLEKWDRIFNEFLNKYKNSSNNIYDINLADKVLSRVLKNELDSKIFLICFCRYCRNMNQENIMDHVFMYYTIYNCVMSDVPIDELGNNVIIGNEFLCNVKQVVENLISRNDFLKGRR